MSPFSLSMCASSSRLFATSRSAFSRASNATFLFARTSSLAVSISRWILPRSRSSFKARTDLNEDTTPPGVTCFPKIFFFVRLWFAEAASTITPGPSAKNSSTSPSATLSNQSWSEAEVFSWMLMENCS